MIHFPWRYISVTFLKSLHPHLSKTIICSCHLSLTTYRHQACQLCCRTCYLVTVNWLKFWISEQFPLFSANQNWSVSVCTVPLRKHILEVSSGIQVQQHDQSSLVIVNDAFLGFLPLPRSHPLISSAAGDPHSFHSSHLPMWPGATVQYRAKQRSQRSRHS